jgi:CRISPR-associated endonuclease Cas2
MAILLVTYDLNEERKKRGDYTELLKEIKKHAWARLSESSYAIETLETPKQIYDKLKRHTDSNDYLLVITLTRPWHGLQSRAVLDWLLQRL